MTLTRQDKTNVFAKGIGSMRITFCKQDKTRNTTQHSTIQHKVRHKTRQDKGQGQDKDKDKIKMM